MMGDVEISPWLKGLPLAPEYHPTEAEFADPIAYISKIEKEASLYGICKIVPPLPKPSKKLVIANLNRSLIESQDTAVACVHGTSLATSRSMSTVPANFPPQLGYVKGQNLEPNVGDGDCKAKFTTRHQQIGWNPKRLRGPMQSVVQKQVWQSGESYTLEQFESKARLFYRSRLGTSKEVAPLSIETLFWKAASDKPISVEYANDIPGTAFGEPNESFSCLSSRGRKRKMYRRARVVSPIRDKDDIGESIQDPGAASPNQNKDGIGENVQDLKGNYKLDPQKAPGMSDDDTGETDIWTTQPVEMIQSPDIAKEPAPGKTTLSEVSDHQGDGMKMRNKSLDWNAEREGGAGWKLSNSAWNMRIVARSPGSLIRHMPDEVPGVTSPMVYIGMLFSWFAWHVEDHELHSLNYLHMGSSKTWYAVPGDAAASLEEVIRVHGYGEHLNPLAAFAMLGEKTTLMSPEILVGAGVPCCRLVQNPGEFVVTFPRAYHLGFSHGFNCGEAANFATPGWLKVAKEAAVRRAAMSYLPMLSHQQLLYMLSLSFPSRLPLSLATEPRSSRLKDRKRGEGEMVVKRRFVNDMIENNHLLSVLLEKEATCYAVLWNSAHISCASPSSPSCFSSLSDAKFSPSFSVGSSEALPFHAAKGGQCKDNLLEMDKLASSSTRVDQSSGNDFEQENGVNCTADRFRHICREGNSMGGQSVDSDPPGDSLHLDSGTLACVACGVLGFPCMAVIQISEEAARNLSPAGYKIIDKHLGMSGSGAARYDITSGGAATTADQSPRLGDNCNMDFLIETPIALESHCINEQDQLGEGLFGQPSGVNTIGNYTASLVDAFASGVSIKHGKNVLGVEKIQHNGFEVAVAQFRKNTEEYGLSSQKQKGVSNLSRLEAASVNLCCVDSTTDSKALLQPMARICTAIACSRNAVNNADNDCQGHSNSLCSPSLFCERLPSTNSHENKGSNLLAVDSTKQIVEDASYKKELPKKYANSEIKNQSEDGDISSEVTNTTMPSAFLVSSTSRMPMLSALDLLAAAYNDASDSDEVNDVVENGDCQPINARPDATLACEAAHELGTLVDAPWVGISHLDVNLLQANPDLSSSRSSEEVIKRRIDDEFISRGHLPGDTPSSVNTRLKESFSNLKQGKDLIGEVCLQGVDRSSSRKTTCPTLVSKCATDFHGELPVTGIDFSMLEMSNHQKQLVCISPCYGGSGSEALPSSEFEHRNVKCEDTGVQMCESSEVPPQLMISSNREAENLPALAVGKSNSILDADVVSKSVTGSPEVSNFVIGESSGEVCANSTEEPSVPGQDAAMEIHLHNESKEKNSREVAGVSIPVMDNALGETGFLRKNICDEAGGNIQVSAATYAFQANITDTTACIGKTASLWKPSKGFMRPHVFCLEHALQVEEQLRSMGGAHLLLLCHSNYPQIEQHARLLAKEIGMDYSWKDNPLKNAVEDDLQMIRVAIDEEDYAESGRDWTAQLGVSLRYSLRLSKSPLYSKQMPYNSVLDELFCSRSVNDVSAVATCDGFDSSSLKWQSRKSRSCYWPMGNGESEVRRKVSKQKKITVAGKWCGRVWMVNQVHPYLGGHNIQEPPVFLRNPIAHSEISRPRGRPRKYAVRDSDGKIMSEQSTITTFDEKMFVPITKNIQNSPITRNSGRKRKMHFEEPIYNGRTKVPLSESGALETAVEDLNPFSSIPVAKPKDLCLGSSVGMAYGVDLSTFSKRKLDAAELTVSCVTASKKSKQILIENGSSSKVEDEYFEEKNSLVDMQIQMGETYSRTNCRASQGCQLNWEGDFSLLHSCEIIQTRKTECSADKFGNLDQEKSDDLLSAQCESYDGSAPLILAALTGTKPSLPDSCQSKPAGKIRSRRKKQLGWNNGVEVISNCSDNVLGTDSRLSSEDHAVQDPEFPASRKPDSCKGHINLHFSSTTGNPPSGPSTRLRTRSTQASVAAAAKDTDKTSIQLGTPSLKKLSKEKKKITKYAPCKDAEDGGSHHCDIEGCIMSFATKQELLLHKRNACTFKGCGKRFCSHKYLLQHRRVHFDDRPLKCPWKGCKMTFKWAWARTEHIRVHTGERPYVCPIAGCGRTFRFVSDFSRHKRKTGHTKQ